MDRFKLFLLNEDKSYLGSRVGDVLTSLQDLQTDMPNMGSRHLTRTAEEIVNQIRKILHSSWKPTQIKHLKELQKIGVALMRTIEDKGDLKEIVPAAAQALQALSGKLGVKVNNLDAPEEMGASDIKMSDFQQTQPPPQQPQPGQPQGQQPPGQQQTGSAPPPMM